MNACLRFPGEKWPIHYYVTVFLFSSECSHSRKTCQHVFRVEYIATCFSVCIFAIVVHAVFSLESLQTLKQKNEGYNNFSQAIKS